MHPSQVGIILDGAKDFNRPLPSWQCHFASLHSRFDCCVATLSTHPPRGPVATSRRTGCVTPSALPCVSDPSKPDIAASFIVANGGLRTSSPRFLSPQIGRSDSGGVRWPSHRSTTGSTPIPQSFRRLLRLFAPSATPRRSASRPINAGQAGHLPDLIVMSYWWSQGGSNP